jgi:hypothetical protein
MIPDDDGLVNGLTSRKYKSANRNGTIAPDVIIEFI